MGSVSALIDDRPDEGIFRLHRDVYTDPALFDLEMRHIFERSWSFLGFASQVSQPHDFFTTHIGRVPVLVSCGEDGNMGAFLNVCRHKGAELCAVRQGKSKSHVCPYHGWIYDSSGRNIHIKDQEQGAYHPSFDRVDHGLLPLAKLDSYKGLIFGSLNADVPPLADFLGDMRFFIDLAMEQGENGMEPIPGRTQYTYRGNWKFQLDNGLDSYHLTSTHLSFMRALDRRRVGEGNPHGNQTDFFKDSHCDTATFGFDHGHTVFTMDNTEPHRRPFWPYIDKLRDRVGEAKADWMSIKMFNSLVFPNMQLAHNTALILRVFRPIAVDLTEMTSYCLGAIGEPAEERAMRLRAFEDFYNAAGLATPDDSVVYERCQQGMATGAIGWLQGFSRGLGALETGQNDVTRPMGINPVESSMGTLQSGQEVVYHPPYREWARLMDAGEAAAPAYP
jgi:phenylpropionate dioxygenase-like ring-hydroxylating dioxygenase large terminal subunit